MPTNTHLFRQIHPAHVKDNVVSVKVFEEISSSSFTPTETDQGCLSVYNGEIFTAKTSFTHYTGQINGKGTPLKSQGTLAVTVEEVESIALTVEHDNGPFDGHSSIDYNSLRDPITAVLFKKMVKIKAKELRDMAVNRGWQFKPSN